MEMNAEQARRALADADAVRQTTRVVADMAGTDLVVMVWGVIWFAGYLWSHWVLTQGWPNLYHAVWFGLVALGMLATFVVERRRTAPVRSTVGARIGMFWGALYVFAFLGSAILSDGLGHPLACGPKAMAAINTVIPMFAYVVMGLWLEQKSFVATGLGLTLVTAVAYFVFKPIFFPVMAVAGGGLLFGFGLWMRIRWTLAMRRLGHYAES